VISGTGSATPDAAAVVSAIEDALAKVEGVIVSFSGVISVQRVEGGCVATMYPIRLDGCRTGDPIHGPIRAAFQMVDLPHTLQTRDGVSQAYPVQAVAVGKATILALGGEVAGAAYYAPLRIVVPHANDTTPLPANGRVEGAVSNVLKRVR
jgi:hypothetical protein